jgi:16S rRNA G1207 methylase RsmC
MVYKTINELKQDIIFEAQLRGNRFIFHSTWGLFSPEHVDEGTRLLVEEVNVGTGDTILDLGCGYGALGLPLAKMTNPGLVYMADKDFIAVEYAKKNAKINNISNCRVYLSNGFDQLPNDIRFDKIVSNLPAKVSKELFWILFNEAKHYLKPGGAFYVVTIKGLKEFIKRNFQEIFGNYKKLGQSSNYIVAMALS